MYVATKKKKKKTTTNKQTKKNLHPHISSYLQTHGMDDSLTVGGLINTEIRHIVYYSETRAMAGGALPTLPVQLKEVGWPCQGA